MDYKRKEKGQSVVEFVLILPVLIIILAGLLDLGRLYYAYVAVTDAAGEGAAYAAIHPTDTNDIKKRAQTASGGLVEIDENLVDVDCVDVDCAAAEPITVTVSYSFTVVTPLINAMVPGGVLPLRAVATEAILPGEL